MEQPIAYVVGILGESTPTAKQYERPNLDPGASGGTAPGAQVCDCLKAEFGSTRLSIFVIPWTCGLLGRGGLAGTRGGCAPLGPRGGVWMRPSNLKSQLQVW